MDWVKKNLLVLIPVVVALIAVPVMVFFSMKMTAGLTAQVESDLSRAVNDLRGIQTNYTIPAVEPGESPFEAQRRPSERMTQAVRERRAAIKDQALQIRASAVERNSRGKELLVDGAAASEQLFPEPINDSARIRLTQEFLRRWPSAHDAMLERFGFGAPPEMQTVLEQLQLTFDRERERVLRGTTSQELEPADIEAIQAVLVAQRLGTYRGRANEVRVYGDASMFLELSDWLPWSSPTDLPSLERMWEWQEATWIHEDLLDGISSANTQADGSAGTVLSGPVKRVLSISIEPWLSARDEGGRGGRGGRGDAPSGDEGAAAGPGPDGTTPIEPDYTWAHTGRFGHPNKPNGLYDIRYATVDLIVDPLRLPQVIDSINRTNFLTVLEQSQAVTIPPGADLVHGYDYGQANLVQLSLRVELAYFREWRVPAMPPRVRERLGIAPTPSGDGGMDDGSMPDGGDGGGGRN
ncbi:MAG: hypothetical protein ACTS3F_06400 [Phycisphaerales bacterium]